MAENDQKLLICTVNVVCVIRGGYACGSKQMQAEAFQFDWSTDFTFIGGFRRRVELDHPHQALRQPRFLSRNA